MNPWPPLAEAQCLALTLIVFGSGLIVGAKTPHTVALNTGAAALAIGSVALIVVRLIFG